MVKVRPYSEDETAWLEMSDGDFCQRFGRFMNEDEVRSLDAGDLVCFEHPHTLGVFEAEVVR
jgi:hypothetical protein